MAACWKLGAIPQPVSAAPPDARAGGDRRAGRLRRWSSASERRRLRRPRLPAGRLRARPDARRRPAARRHLAGWKAPTSGGSTGRPKLIVVRRPGVDRRRTPPRSFGPADGCLVVPGPLYHNGPFVWSCAALLAGSHVVLLPRFDAEATLAPIDTLPGRHRLPRADDDEADLAAARGRPRPATTSRRCSVVWHLAEPCPPWLKEAWIDWLGPDRIFELYAGTEAQAATVITGAEWLAAPRLGRPPVTGDGDDLRRRRQRGAGRRGGRGLAAHRRPTSADLPLRRRRGPHAATAAGSPSATWAGSTTTATSTWPTARQDMILAGGANVYPAEVEAALEEHPAVRSCVVIGLPDDDLGNRVHAIVEADPATSTTEPTPGLPRRAAGPLQGPAHARVRRRAAARRRRQGAPRRAQSRSSRRAGALPRGSCGRSPFSTTMSARSRDGRMCSSRLTALMLSHAPRANWRICSSGHDANCA